MRTFNLYIMALIVLSLAQVCRLVSDRETACSCYHDASHQTVADGYDD